MRAPSHDEPTDRGGPGPSAHAAEPGDARLPAVVADLRRRLHPVCRDWDEGAFESLIREVARRKLRWTDGAERR